MNSRAHHESGYTCNSGAIEDIVHLRGERTSGDRFGPPGEVEPRERHEASGSVRDEAQQATSNLAAKEQQQQSQ